MASIKRRIALVGGLVAATATVTAITVTSWSSIARAREAIEIPEYEVLSTHDGFEVRRYAPRIVAEVEVQGRGREATNAGFRVLADFIFGNNETQDSIAMTAPVDRRAASTTIEMTAPVDRRAVDTEGDDDQPRWIIAFTMPSQWTMQTLPRPRDERVRIREVPPAAYAVMRFSGAPSEKKVQRRMEVLEQAVLDAGLTPAGPSPTYARYDPPWTLPMLRRNEILLELSMPELTEQPEP